MYEKILVPLDGSRRAEAILGHVERLAACFGSRVIFLRVIEPPPTVVDPPEIGINTYIDTINRAEEEAERYLIARQGEFREKDIEATYYMQHGSVVKIILDVARTEKADLIAMASHGRSGLANLFYGSVALGVLHRADRPLLLVRAAHDQ